VYRRTARSLPGQVALREADDLGEGFELTLDGVGMKKMIVS